MQVERIENLKKLIGASPILSLRERAEWLMLLNFMNDKQLLELERIIGSRQQLVVISQQSVISSQKTEASFPGAASSAAAANFLSRIKLIFTEKELPPGRPEQALNSSVTTAIKTPVIHKYEPLQAYHPISPAPTASKPVGPSLPPIPPTPPPATSLAPKTIIPPPTEEKPKIDLSKITSIKTAPVVYNNIKPAAPVKNTTAGISFAETTEKSRADTLAAIKQHMQETAPLKPARPLSSKPLNIASLEDLAALDARVFQDDLATVVKKIRDLIGQFGYHQVIFYIEKSPLYKIYIATGLKLLSEQISFEELGQKSNPEPYLEREEFEKFTDLLRQIQEA